MSKKLFVGALLAAFMFSANAMAQQPADETIERRIEMLDEALDLSDDQKAEIRRIWREHRVEMAEWAASNEGADREARREHRRATADGVHEDIRAVLTPEQAEKLDALREERRERSMEHRDDRPKRQEGAMHGRDGQQGQRAHGAGHGVGHDAQHGPGHGAQHEGHQEFIQHFIEELDLTDSQRAEVEAVFEAHHASGMAWREANSDATREEMQAFHEEHFKSLRGQLQNTLNENQLERLEEMHHNMRNGMMHDGGH